MKLRILNGGHAAIAYPGALLGHHFVHDAMADPRVRDWLDALIKREIIPTLRPIKGVDYQRYRETIVERFSNPKIGDTIPRLCLDGSNRQPKFILPTLADALRNGGDIDGLALEVALWCRYCAGTTDAGEPLEVKDDSRADLQRRALEARTRPAAFLENAAVFGDLGQDPRFATGFAAALASLWGRGVEATLAAYVG
jgi:mannitol 2-dehydrogenase